MGERVRLLSATIDALLGQMDDEGGKEATPASPRRRRCSRARGPGSTEAGLRSTMELDVQRHERIIAPSSWCWEEMDSLDQILAKSPQISEYESYRAVRRLGGGPKLTWGPVKWAVDVEVSLTDFVARQHVVFVIEAPSLETRASRPGPPRSLRPGRRQTKLDYRCGLEVRHRMASRMRGVFNEILEDLAHSILHRVKVKSEQRRLAQERLLK